MLFSMSEAAKATGIAPYRIKYALQTQRLPEPGRVGGRRVFGPDDVELIRRHFAGATGIKTTQRPQQDRNRK
jgi:DNA-binding transcriptional MerR regulator